MADGRSKIRIPDLRRPVLSDAQRLALEHAERNPVELTEKAVLSAAIEATGLDDLGPDDFRERLRLWLEEADGDTNRTALGRATIFGYCLRYASTRLRIQDMLSRHPEIHDVEIEQPIVVVGLPRSGTTHLLNLIGADTRLRSLPLWESYEPVPVDNEPAGAGGLDPRFLRCAQMWEGMQATSPYISAMHPMNPEHIHEEIELQGPDFSSYNFEWLMGGAPDWRDYYLAHDQTPHYEYMKTVLKLLQWQRGPDRWVLKSPQHFEQLGPLLKTFPDATVVICHRDPVSVVQSAATMLTYGARMSKRHVEPDAMIEYWTDRIERLLRAGIRDLHVIPEGERFDVLFHAFMADDVAMVERIYATAGLPMTSTCREEMDSYMAAHPRGKYGEVLYDLRGDFDVDPAAMRERFAFYFDAIPVQVEVT